MKGTIRQRGQSSWELQVFLGRDTSGKRMRKTETVRGKKSDAERRLREILSDLDRGITPSKTRYKVGEWCDKWLEDKIAPYRRQKTIDRYEGIIRLHIKPNLGHLQLTKLSPMHIQDFETKLLEDGKAPKGVQAIHHVLSGAFKHAARMELIHRNPVALVSPPSLPKEEAYSPELDEVLCLLKLAVDEGHPLLPFIHLIAFTGMRRGEGLALTWDNVDLDEGVVHVVQSLVVTSNGLVLEPPKTARGQRDVYLDQLTGEVLKKHRANQEEIARKLETQAPSVVFPRWDSDEWQHPNTVMHAARRLAKRAECPDATLRSLRHFHASVALQANLSPVVVSERLGHSSPKITMEIYAHSLSGWQKQSVEIIANAMRPAA